MKTIIFSEEFEKKLKKLKIKTKFIKNLKKRYPKKALVEFGCSTQSWSDFIHEAFLWGETPEGLDYWFNISRK